MEHFTQAHNTTQTARSVLVTCKIVNRENGRNWTFVNFEWSLLHVLTYGNLTYMMYINLRLVYFKIYTLCILKCQSALSKHFNLILPKQSYGLCEQE